MIKPSFWGGLLCGSLATASVMLVLQNTRQSQNPYIQHIDSSGHTSRDTREEPLSTSTHEVQDELDRSLSAFGSQSKATVGKSQQNSIQETNRHTENCGEKCLSALVAKFMDVADLSASDWDHIRENSDKLAAIIAEDNDALNALQDMMAYAMDDREIDGLMTVASTLPDDKALDMIREVSNYSNTHKALALQTLAGMSLYSQNAAREIENLVIDEQDPKVISAALNALETTDNHDFSPQTWQSLSNQFSYVQDAQLKGSILLSLAKHGKGDPGSLQSNIEEGLGSQSYDLQRASIEALGYFISRPENEKFSSPTIDSASLESQLNAIANNPEADSALRIEALTLLQEKF